MKKYTINESLLILIECAKSQLDILKKTPRNTDSVIEDYLTKLENSISEIQNFIKNSKLEV